ncbi:MAG: hypothetical protein ACM359_25160 [Bacillota bacterium]
MQLLWNSDLLGAQIPDLLGVLIPLAAVIGGITIAVISVITTHAVKARQAELEAALKRDMINRGMSAEQIKQVLEAHMHSPTGK